MTSNGRQMSNPFSTGGGGHNFETLVQAYFVALMLAGGFAPGLPDKPIRKIKLQGRCKGYQTDDLIIFTDEHKLLGQIKHKVAFTKGNLAFGKVIQSAWLDFNNPDIFTCEKDVIALITGPLSSTDIEDVRPLLEWARCKESEKEFLQIVEIEKVSSESKRDKLKVLRECLETANQASISNENFFQFLRHFYLFGYDFDIESGVTETLIHSVIGRFVAKNPCDIFNQIVRKVMSTNQNAGTINRETLLAELPACFDIPNMQTMPQAISSMIPPREIMTWNMSPFADVLVVASLAGSWNQNYEADLDIIKQLLQGVDFATWQDKIEQVLQLPDSPIVIQNGVWEIRNRAELWETLGPRIFDRHLDMLKTCSLAILRKGDPQFEIEPDQRFMASIYGKILPHSEHLRRGITETLALLGSLPDSLTHCSLGRPKLISMSTIRELFEGADWVLWESLNYLLPLLAEAAPDEFLDAVETAILQTPCPFDELYAQAGSGILTRCNYLTGLLWALEAIAWDAEYLVRATVVLGALAKKYPRSNSGNHPSDSLTGIFLPWLPQTTAPLEKRKVAIETLTKESPNVAWELLLQLLPNRIMTSTPTSKPTWRKVIPDDWKDGTTRKEYWDQITIYAEMLEKAAYRNISRLKELFKNLDWLPEPTFEKILNQTSSEELVDATEEDRYEIWSTLVQFASKHRRFSGAQWALPGEMIKKVEEAVGKISPKQPEYLYGRLFSQKELDLYEEDGSWQEREDKLEERRQQVVSNILESDRIEGVIHLAESVDSPYKVGIPLGKVATESADEIVLPTMLNSDNQVHVSFATGFVLGRFLSQRWTWVDTVIKDDWTDEDKGRFLTLLPFTHETWTRVENLLINNRQEYWQKVPLQFSLSQSEEDLQLATDHLLEYNRPWAAINCLARQLYRKFPIDPVKAVKALLDAASPTERFDVYRAIPLIKMLQENKEAVGEDNLVQVEWAYLPLLNDHYMAEPVSLESRLATKPEFFAQMVGLVYRSNKETPEVVEPSEQEKLLAKNAPALLERWKTPPGFSGGDEFSEEEFNRWLDSAIQITSDSGHLGPALYQIGRVLIHCPLDPEGLWIHKTAAEALNKLEHEEMRCGFSIAIRNSRGACLVDPTGTPELKLAEEYRQKAEDVENTGYHRLAITLRKLAESYDHDAQIIVAQYGEH